MAAASRRVVVTGIGLVSPLGLTVEAFRDSLATGRSGIRPIRGFDASALPVHFAGEVIDFDAREYLDKKDRKMLKMMVRTIQLAVAAARLALADAGIGPGTLDPARLGVSLGTGTIPGDLLDLGAAARASYDPERCTVDLARWGRDGLPLIPPMWMLNHVPNMPACHVSILHDARGPNNTITQSDAAGLLAPGEAAAVIARGAADVMLTGGSDTHVNPISIVRYHRFSRLSLNNAAPDRACRPFDRRRDGQVVGEGGCVLVFEELEHARRRGARILAEWLGFAAGFDLGRSGSGLARVIRLALQRAGVSPGEIDHVNAQAGGLIEEDAREARGLREAVADTPVTAVKSYLGNLGAAAGATELAASLVAMRDGVVPGTLNHDEDDPDCPVHVLRQPRPLQRDCFLKVSATERGQCGAAVLRRWA